MSRISVKSNIDPHDFEAIIGFIPDQNENISNTDFLFTYSHVDDPKWIYGCAMRTPLQKAFIYENQNIISDKKIINVPYELNQNHILEIVEQSGYIPSSIKSSSTKYIITSKIITENNMIKIMEIPLNNTWINTHIYSSTYFQGINRFCPANRFRFVRNMRHYVFITFLVILCLRLKFYKLPVKLTEAKDLDLWFSTCKGVAITKPASLDSTCHKKLMKLIKESLETKKEQSYIIEYERSPGALKIWRLNVYPVSGTLFLVVKWGESFVELAEKLKHTLYGTEIRTCDQEVVQKPPINLSYDEYGLPVAEIPFHIDDSAAKIKITSTTKTQIPFRRYALHLSYIDYMHLNMLHECWRLNPTQEAFLEFIKMVYQRLDYSALCIYSSYNSKLTKIASFVRNEETSSLIENFIEEAFKLPPGNDRSFRELGGYRFVTNRFCVGDINYVIFTSVESSKLILQVNEQKFHFILSCLVAFHHSVLSSKGEARSLMRIYTLLEQTQLFTLVECVGQPSNFLQAHGSLFGVDINQEAIDLFLRYVSPEMRDDLMRVDGRKEFDQVVIPFKNARNVEVCVSLSSTSYFDETLQNIIYVYLVEDITTFHEKSVRLREANEDVRLASDFLGLHKVNADFTLSNPTALSKELGYDHALRNVREYLFEDDKGADFTVLEKTPKLNVRLLSGLGHPVWYTVIRSPSDGGFFFFSSREMRQMRAMSKKNDDTMIQGEHSGAEQAFYLVTADIENGEVLSIITNRRAITPKQGESVDERLVGITNATIPEDQVIVQEAINTIKSGRVKFAKCYVRLVAADLLLMAEDGEKKPSESDTSKEWYNIVLSVTPNKRLVILIFSDDEKTRHARQIQESIETMEASFLSANKLLWTFTDTTAPETLYQKAPIGQNNFILNWSTIGHNVREDKREEFSTALAAALRGQATVDIIVPMVFGGQEKNYLFRGRARNGQVQGVVTNMNWMFKMIKSSGEMRETRRRVTEFCDLMMVMTEISSAAMTEEDDLELASLVQNSFSKIKACVPDIISC